MLAWFYQFWVHFQNFGSKKGCWGTKIPKNRDFCDFCGTGGWGFSGFEKIRVVKKNRLSCRWFEGPQTPYKKQGLGEATPLPQKNKVVKKNRLSCRWFEGPQTPYKIQNPKNGEKWQNPRIFMIFRKCEKHVKCMKTWKSHEIIKNIKIHKILQFYVFWRISNFFTCKKKIIFFSFLILKKKFENFFVAKKSLKFFCCKKKKFFFHF